MTALQPAPLTAEALPGQIAGLRRGRTIPYDPEHPETRASVAYRAPGIDARIALYDRDLVDIAEGPQSSVIYSEVNRVLAELNERVELGIYQGVRIKDQYVTGPSRDAQEFFCVEYCYLQRGESYHGNVYLTGHDGLVVKVLFEQAESDAEPNRPAVFAKRLAAFLRARRVG